MQLRATTHETNGVTLVSLIVSNESEEPRRFRVANRLDGPVWAPRVHGTIAAGWDEAGYEGVLAAGGTRPLGYATTGSSADPPAEVVWSEPAGESETVDAGPEAVLRSLGDPRPPADVVVPDYLLARADRERDEGDRP